MERNKLEKQFKDQLNSRKIEPSAMAWNKIDAMLTDAEEKKAKRKFNWMYVAASFIGFLFIGILFFSKKENAFENKKNRMVIEESIPAKSHKESIKYVDPTTHSARVAVQKTAIKTNTNSTSNKDSLTSKNKSYQNQIAEFSIINKKENQESISTQIKAVTVDELLARVDKSARLNNKSNPNLEIHVNENQLLQQVETDLEPSFRQSVFSKIAENFKVIKEAVVNRNKE